MRSLRRALHALALLLCGLGALAVWVWRSEDSIGHAAYKTDWLLLGHAVLDRSAELRDWITRYHGEGPSMAVMMSFVGWSIDQPGAAERLVAGLSPKEQQELAARVGWSARDSGQGAKFVGVFARRESPFIRLALKELE